MLVAILMLLTYLIALVAGGDGALPMGGFLVLSLLYMGRSGFSWGISGIIAGWIGIIGLISATFLLRSNPLKQFTYQFLFCVILYLSWLILAIIGTDGRDYYPLFSSFVLSTPFQITFLIVAYRFMIRRREIDIDSKEKLP